MLDAFFTSLLRRCAGSRLLAAATLLSGTLCMSACPAAPEEPSGESSFHFALTATPSPITAGADGAVDVTINRPDSFDEAITMDLIEAPDGITLTSGSSPGGATSYHATIHVASTVPTGTAYITLHGHSLSGSTSSLRVGLVVVQSGSYNLTASKTLLTLVPGTAEPVTITVARSSFSTPVTLSVTRSSTDLATTISPSTVTASTAALTITLAAAPAQTATNYLVTVHAHADGAEDRSIDITVLRVAAARYTLTPHTATLTIPAGSSLTQTIDIGRLGGFAGTIALDAVSEQGITALPVSGTTTVPGTATSADYTVTVPQSTTLGNHIVTVTGQVDGTPAVVTTFMVNVTAPVTNTTWTFCPSAGVPFWVAVQDGVGLWQQTTSSNSVYAFQINSATGGIAWVASRGNTTELHVLYGSRQELQTQGNLLCGNTGALKTVSGTLANTGTAAAVGIGLGSSYSLAFPPASTFQLSRVAPGPLDLLAATVDGASPPNGLRMVLRRNINPADGSTLAAIDFTGSEAVVPATGTLTLVNSLGQQISMMSEYLTSNNALTKYYGDRSSSAVATRQFFGVPALNQVAGELHYLSAQALTGSGATTSYRTAGNAFTAVGPQTLTFGSALSAVTVAFITGSGQAQPEASWAAQAEYGKLWEVSYDQASSTAHAAVVQMTSAYRGSVSGTIQLRIPDFSSVGGWLPSYGLSAGVDTPWKATASTWSTATGVIFPVLTPGITFTSATAQGTITTQ